MLGVWTRCLLIVLPWILPTTPTILPTEEKSQLGVGQLGDKSESQLTDHTTVGAGLGEAGESINSVSTAAVSTTAASSSMEADAVSTTAAGASTSMDEEDVVAEFDKFLDDSKKDVEVQAVEVDNLRERDVVFGHDPSVPVVTGDTSPRVCSLDSSTQPCVSPGFSPGKRAGYVSLSVSREGCGGPPREHPDDLQPAGKEDLLCAAEELVPDHAAAPAIETPRLLSTADCGEEEMTGEEPELPTPAPSSASLDFSENLTKDAIQTLRRWLEANGVYDVFTFEQMIKPDPSLRPGPLGRDLRRDDESCCPSSSSSSSCGPAGRESQEGGSSPAPSFFDVHIWSALSAPEIGNYESELVRLNTLLRAELFWDKVEDFLWNRFSGRSDTLVEICGEGGAATVRYDHPQQQLYRVRID